MNWSENIWFVVTSSVGTLFSGITSVLLVWFTIRVHKDNEKRKMEYANYYLKRVKSRIRRMLEVIEKNYVNQGEDFLEFIKLIGILTTYRKMVLTT